MIDKNTIEKTLSASRPTLTTAERASMWTKVAAEIQLVAGTKTQSAVRSPYWTYFTASKLSVSLVALVLMISTGSIVVASGSAKPGDSLFSVKRGFEEVRLALATPSQGETLRTQFARERLTELQAILNEEATADTALALAEPTAALAVIEQNPASQIEIREIDSPAQASDSFLAKTREVPKGALAQAVPANLPLVDDLRVEIDVFTDTTVVKVEQFGISTRYVMNEDSRAAVVAAVATQLGLSEEEVDKVTDFASEDRSSRPAERGGAIDSVRGEARVGTAVTAFINGLAKVPEPERQELIKDFANEMNIKMYDTNPMQGGIYPLRLDDHRVELESDGVRVSLDGEQYEVRFGSDDRNEMNQTGDDNFYDYNQSHDDNRSGSGKGKD